ncbi:hypothetical protein EMIT053CA3_190070 [Pseudomonas donghuensis]
MTITSGLQASPSDCWSRSYQESGLSCLRSESVTLVVFVIGNYRKLQQWIYEFCYQLGMHLEFHYRRRILIGPMCCALAVSVFQRSGFSIRHRSSDVDCWSRVQIARARVTRSTR